MDNSKNFIISSDSCCDLLPSHLRKNNVNYVAMPFILDGEIHRPEYETDEEYKGFYNLMRAGKMPTTSQLNVGEMQEYFEGLLKNNEGDLIHITLSSGLSGTYAAAVTASEAVISSHPGRKIFVMDSLSAALGQGMLTDRAVRLRAEGKTAEETFNDLKEATKNLQHWVYIDDLNHLRRGGRISSASAVIGTMLRLKPVVSMNIGGALKVIHKTIGMNRAFKQIITRMKDFWPYKDTQQNKVEVYVAHGDDKEALEKLVSLIKENFNCEITTGYLGPVIGAHTGFGSLSVFFFGTPRLVC